MCLGLVVRGIHEGACAWWKVRVRWLGGALWLGLGSRAHAHVWIPSPPQRVIGPDAYYPLEGGGVMKEPPPSLIVAGLANFGVGKSSQEENSSSM